MADWTLDQLREAVRNEPFGTLDRVPMTVIRDLLSEVRARCATIARHATVRPYSCTLHPDIPFDQMSETARLAAHTTAQTIARAILDDASGGPCCPHPKDRHTKEVVMSSDETLAGLCQDCKCDRQSFHRQYPGFRG